MNCPKHNVPLKKLFLENSSYCPECDKEKGDYYRQLSARELDLNYIYYTCLAYDIWEMGKPQLCTLYTDYEGASLAADDAAFTQAHQSFKSLDYRVASVEVKFRPHWRHGQSRNKRFVYHDRAAAKLDNGQAKKFGGSDTGIAIFHGWGVTPNITPLLRRKGI